MRLQIEREIANLIEKERAAMGGSNKTDAIAIRTMMYLALSYDHRVVDGVLGNRFLYRAARILEEADFEL